MTRKQKQETCLLVNRYILMQCTELSEIEKEIVIKYFVEDKTLEKIGAQLNISLGKTRTHLSKAMYLIRKEMEEDEYLKGRKILYGK